jgi:hypothetical protein
MSHCLRSVATAVSGSGDEVTLIVCGQDALRAGVTDKWSSETRLPMRVDKRLSSIRREPRPGGTFDSSPPPRGGSRLFQKRPVPQEDDRLVACADEAVYEPRIEGSIVPYRDGAIFNAFPTTSWWATTKCPSVTDSLTPMGRRDLIATFILTRVGSCERDSGFPPTFAATNAPPVLVLSDRARLF